MFKYFLKKKSNSKSINLAYVDKKVKWWKSWLLVLPAVVVISLFIIIPFLISARNSLEYYPNPHKKDHVAYGFKTIHKLLADEDFTMAIQNTVIYAVISVPILISLSAVISAVISSIIRKRLRGFWQTVFFIPYVTSAIAIALSFAYLFEQDHGIVNWITGKNTPWLRDTVGHKALVPMLVNGIWKGLAFNILIFTTTMLSVNKNLYKSASIDGAGGVKQFFTITLPSIKRSTSFLIFMSIIGSTKIFPLALFQNQAEDAITYHASTLMIYIYYNIGRNPFLAGAGSVALVLISISLTIIIKGGMTKFIKLIRYISEGNIRRKVRGYRVY